MMGPLVTIVTPSFNQAAFLESTIESVLGQDYPAIEYIIIDGGSTDGSVDIIKKYERRLQHWVSEPDRGQAHAINKGWLRARGQYVGWLNSDDELTASSISTLVRQLETHPDVGIVFGGIERINVRGNSLGLQTAGDFELVPFVRDVGGVSQPGSLIRRSILDRIGLLDEGLHFMMDHDLWLRAAVVSRIVRVDEVVARFRIHDDAKSSQRLDVAARDVHSIYDKLYARTDLPESLREVEQAARANAHVFAATALFGADDMRGARAELLSAMRADLRSVARKAFVGLLPRLVAASVIGGRHSVIANFARTRLRRH